MNPSLAHEERTRVHPLTAAREQLATELWRVERILCDASWGPVASMVDVAEHLMGAGGKRLRPLLCLLAARHLGVDERYALPVAAASEMIHSASLLHDDVIDQTPMRRGKLAAPLAYGNSTCVLVGDALMARSLTMLGELPDHTPLTALARCVRRMAVGELQQLSTAGRPHPRLLGYIRVIEGKTSALFAWCTTVGEMCPAPVRPAMRRFGRRLGMAFQIADDVLDFTGDASLTGKSVGADLREGKFTLPLHYACEEDPLLREQAIALACAHALPSDNALDELVRRVLATRGVGRARAFADRLRARAHHALDETPDSPWRGAMHAIADYIVDRNR